MGGSNANWAKLISFTLSLGGGVAILGICQLCLLSCKNKFQTAPTLEVSTRTVDIELNVMHMHTFPSNFCDDGSLKRQGVYSIHGYVKDIES